MSYLEDTIDWQAIEYINRWLDDNVSDDYKDQPLAQDWARTCKVIEEIAEATERLRACNASADDWARVSAITESLGRSVAKLIKFTGQNPRKPAGNVETEYTEFLAELADTAITAILGMMHFTASSFTVRQILKTKIAKIEARAIDDTRRRLDVDQPNITVTETDRVRLVIREAGTDN